MLKKLVAGLAIEFGPILVFFFAAELMNFISATALFVCATLISLTVSYVKRKHIALFPLIVGIIITTFGLATVFFENPFFIIIKDTAYNGIFAVILFIGLYFKKPLLKPLFDSLFAVTDKGWMILSWRWAWLFTILAVSNELVRMHLTTHGWVVYKMLTTIATIIFMAYQVRLGKKERLPDASAWGIRIVYR
jgi:intracellular septation protein